MADSGLADAAGHPGGLDADALAVVRTMIDAKVDIAGVNVMAMDFGVPSGRKDMLGPIELLADRHPGASSARCSGPPEPPRQLLGQARRHPR